MQIKLFNVWLAIRIGWATMSCVFYLLFARFFFKKRTNDYVYVRIANWGKQILEILKVKVEIIGKQHIRFLNDRLFLIMSNHVSFLDIPLMYALFEQEKITMVAKKELFRIPIFGLGMKLAGSIKIDRSNHRQALKDLEQAKQQMLGGIRVWIAPEGTRSKTGQLGPFKRGGFKLAKELDAMIIPVTIQGAAAVWPVGGINFGLNKTIKVIVHPVIDSQDYLLEELMQQTREVIDDQKMDDHWV